VRRKTLYGCADNNPWLMRKEARTSSIDFAKIYQIAATIGFGQILFCGGATKKPVGSGPPAF
jgi:hypothetical protein